LAITETFLRRSRALWVKREKEYKRKAEHAHQMHKRRERQLAELAQAAASRVVMPMKRITADSWGYHPGAHDGIDLICPPNEPLIAMCRATVVRVSDEWWGLGNPGGATGDKGDGIIILRSLVDAGPFRKGLNLCYGHAEHPSVKVGQVVEAGQVIGKAGFANAWHVHFMVNGRSDTKGVGDRDPRPYLDYAKKGK
jgi:murein DD-endopeptidase MepM/ murein hydrolase activator NlpD